MSESVFDGVRILDFTVALAGPYSTMLMASMGADVIKIENPVLPPPGGANRTGAPDDNIGGMSFFFANANAGKRAVSINLKSEEGKEIFTKLIQEADVLVENNRPGVMKRLGFDYESVCKINPRIIYASGSGFGQTGLYWRNPGYDIIGQAMGGSMSVTGFPGDPPMNAEPSFSDCSVSVNLCNAIAAALLNREITGKGSYVETCLVDGVVTDQEYQMPFAVYGEEPKQIGNRYNRVGGPMDGYYAADGYFVIQCTTQKEFEDLCHVMGKPELITDERFATPEARLASAQADDPLKAIITAWAADKKVEEVFELLKAADVPAFPIYNFKDIFESDHIRGTREMFTTATSKEGAEMLLTGTPIKMSKYKTAIVRACSALGGDNDEIIGALGYSKEELDELRAKGVIS